MMKKFRNLLKNEKGLTLIELLAVVVILGIIAAIAVPSIGNLIDNSKKDAHAANAQQMINSARLLVIEDTSKSVGSQTITLDELIDGNFIEQIEDPDKKGYTNGEVKLDEGKVIEVTLITSLRTTNAKIDASNKTLNVTRADVKPTTP
ncbi:competence type IV pilus major pilin ComGC [Sutcliffiella halmapala]|uniref:competence type IV pilus major pilin ComGC n=1 Tax=Sutcliffiella halmapala TaxID=79882 RepID=UPI0009957A50|nr:prepilin-type N-terminal cleavage/methylation domain-containing protein [Sutcliffiella halmapala]